MIARGQRRRFRLGLQTLLGSKARGFFIPYRYAADIAYPSIGRHYAAMADVFAAATPRFAGVIAEIERYGAALNELEGEPPPAPRFEQDWFPRLDAAVAYALIRSRRPKRLVEVGSGHSTRFFVRAARDEDFSLQLTAIDPAPRANVSRLPIRMIRSTVQKTDETPFTELGPGDVVSIDSSHILMPGTDVDILLNRILPKLAAGALVHFHDVFLPEDYPVSWAWRGYNEQLGIAALLQGGGWRVVWSSRYVLQHRPELLADSVLERLPLVPGAFESSLWLEKL